jgi:ureidoglycolate lyase
VILDVQSLTPEAFARFGDVLMGLDAGSAPERHEFAARFQNLRSDAKPNLTFMRVPVANGNVAIRALERHRFSNQVFVPLNGTHHLAVVCPSTPAGAPDLAGLQAYIASGAQAINYAANVWHAPRTALSLTGEFIMFRWDGGSPDDTELLTLDDEILVRRIAPDGPRP